VFALFLLDTVVPGVHFLWFRIAAVGVGTLALATGIPRQWQVAVFVGLAVCAALWVKQHVQPDVVESACPSCALAGVLRKSTENVAPSLAPRPTSIQQ
jgi:membrane protein implicated in regulation of membrane protease activity